MFHRVYALEMPVVNGRLRMFGVASSLRSKVLNRREPVFCKGLAVEYRRADEAHILNIGFLHLLAARGGGVLDDDDVVIEGKRVVAGASDAVRCGRADEHDGIDALVFQLPIERRSEKGGEPGLHNRQLPGDRGERFGLAKTFGPGI